MGYNEMEAAALTVLQVLGNYSSTNSSRGDYRILRAGITRAVILEPGSIPERQHQALPRVLQTTWNIIFSVHVNYGGDAVVAGQRIRTDRQEVMDHFDKYPTLDGTAGCIHAMIIGGREPEQWGGENNTWWRQELILQVQENASITIAE